MLTTHAEAPRLNGPAGFQPLMRCRSAASTTDWNDHVDAEHRERRHLQSRSALKNTQTAMMIGMTQATISARVGTAVRGETCDSHRVAGDHLVARERVQQSAGGRLQAQHARQERDDGDDQEDLRADRSERGVQDAGDRIRDLARSRCRPGSGAAST